MMKHASSEEEGQYIRVDIAMSAIGSNSLMSRVCICILPMVDAAQLRR